MPDDPAQAQWNASDWHGKMLVDRDRREDRQAARCLRRCRDRCTSVRNSEGGVHRSAR